MARAEFLAVTSIVALNSSTTSTLAVTLGPAPTATVFQPVTTETDTTDSIVLSKDAEVILGVALPCLVFAIATLAILARSRRRSLRAAQALCPELNGQSKDARDLANAGGQNVPLEADGQQCVEMGEQVHYELVAPNQPP